MKWYLIKKTNQKVITSHDYFSVIMNQLAMLDGEWLISWGTECIEKGNYYIKRLSETDIIEL